MRIIPGIAALALLTSCSISRAYLADGTDGPTSFSYERQLNDTIVNRSEVFAFKRAENCASWIDTLHFFRQGRKYSDATMWEAIGPKTETQGVLIVQNDSIVYEKCTGGMAVDRIAGVFSVAKSLTSLLCGIAVDEGYVGSIDDPVTDYLPGLKKKDPMWQRLTIRHLLDMRSGLDFDDSYRLSLKVKDIKRLHAMSRLYYGRDIMAQVKKLKFRCEPGAEYDYNSMTTEILGLVIESATGRSYADYLEEKVWQPLGMQSPALLSYDSRKHHVPHVFGGLAMTMQDLAKIGRLYLNNGVWEGKRIVSESWIEQSTTCPEDNHGYHFCWYTKTSGYYAMGMRGQVLFVYPGKGLIMVRLGLRNDTDAHVQRVFEQLGDMWPE